MLKTVGEHTILYAMAASAEYGEHLQKRFTPLMTGVGPIEAAISLATTLGELKQAQTLPDLVVCLGSAGSATLAHCQVYQASSMSWRDMDASALGFEKGRTPFLDLPAEIAAPIQIPGIASARLSTGGNVVSGKAYQDIDADMVDMEAYAALRACTRFGVPMIALRGISDGKDELKGLSDWTDYLHLVDSALAEAVDTLERTLENDALIRIS